MNSKTSNKPSKADVAACLRVVAAAMTLEEGHYIEFLDDRFTDKGPCSGSVDKVKITVDGLYALIKCSDGQVTLSLDDIYPYLERATTSAEHPDPGKTLWLVHRTPVRQGTTMTSSKNSKNSTNSTNSRKNSTNSRKNSRSVKVRAVRVRAPEPVTFVYALDGGPQKKDVMALFDVLGGPGTDIYKIEQLVRSDAATQVWRSVEKDINPLSLSGETVIDLNIVWSTFTIVTFSLTCYDDLAYSSGGPTEVETTQDLIDLQERQSLGVSIAKRISSMSSEVAKHEDPEFVAEEQMEAVLPSSIANDKSTNLLKKDRVPQENFREVEEAASKVVSKVRLSKIEELLIDLDVEFFPSEGRSVEGLVVQLDSDNDSVTIKKVVQDLAPVLKLKVKPGATTKPSFALVGPEWTIRKVGSVLQIYKN